MDRGSVSVVVGTFGQPHWVNLAHQRAIPSVPEGVEVIYRHGDTLAQARNEGLKMVRTEWVIHLDADDELDPDYIEAMAKGKADLRAPSRLDLHGPRVLQGPYMPRVWGHEHDCKAKCLRQGNWMVVGTAVRADLARSVGGWEEFGWSEDWALWARCWKAGATVEAIPEAIYRAHWSPRSRNKVANAVGVDWHRQIERAVWPEEVAA